jgi:serpin B
VGLELFRKLGGGAQPGNLAISPYSIESAMALAYAGADGETRTEMARVLGFPEDDHLLQAAFASVRDSMDHIASESLNNAKKLEAVGGHAEVIEWHAANRLFGQQGYGFRDSFLRTLNDGYGAPFEAADFKEHSDQERLRINGWVEDQTRKRIRDLIPMNGVNAGTRMVLVNALYLNAPWMAPFDKRNTADRSFYPAGARTEAVPTMHEVKHLGYLEGTGYTAVTLRYLGGELQLLILLPHDRDGLGRLLAEITPEVLRDCGNIADPSAVNMADQGAAARYNAALREIQRSGLVALYLPKFRLEGATIGLGQSLKALGIRTAFDEPKGSANFDRAAPRKPDDYLTISEVFHKTFIAVEEHGTEAAAATAAAMVAAAAMAKPETSIEVHVDHPFFFAIQHRASGVCLFLGSVSDPR